tara:strand:+ start:813 stop:1364 length:552 start_codon:yes stop_codon:yes gene_type:complete
MHINPTNISDLFVVDTDYQIDSRGTFARIFCDNNLKKIIKHRKILQINHSTSSLIGSIRGMHYQIPPYSEMKLVRCIKGSVWDVALDIRYGSPSFLKWHAELLTSKNSKMMVIPEGFAHGFQVMEKDSELIYLHTESYNKDADRGILHDDEKLSIAWPLQVSNISEKDKSYNKINDEFKGIKI